MNLQNVDWDRVLNTNHPARPYLLGGAVLGLYGLFRSNITGLLAIGGAAVLASRALQEMERIDTLHGGQTHGINGPTTRLP